MPQPYTPLPPELPAAQDRKPARRHDGRRGFVIVNEYTFDEPDNDGVPILTDAQVRTLQRACDRGTIAVLILTAVIVVIQLGRCVLGGAA